MSMFTYQVLVDVAEEWNDDDIGVIHLHVDGKDAEDAYENAIKEIDEGKHDEDIDGRQVFVWSVSEEDKIIL